MQIWLVHIRQSSPFHAAISPGVIPACMLLNESSGLIGASVRVAIENTGTLYFKTLSYSAIVFSLCRYMFELYKKVTIDVVVKPTQESSITIFYMCLVKDV